MSLVLVVDDEKDMRLALANALKHEGYTVIGAADGFTALDILKKEPIELVLLDIRMPNMDGIEVLEKIKQDYFYLPVIMVTGYGSIESAVASIKKGAFEYILKPFDLTKLVAVMEKAIQVSTLERGEGLLDRQMANTLGIKKKVAEIKRKKQLKRGTLLKIAAGFLIILISAFFAFIAVKKYGWEKKEYTIASNHPSAMAYRGGDIYISDWVKEEITVYKRNSSLEPVKTYVLSGKHINGITIMGEYLYSCDGWDGKIYRHKLEDNLAVDSVYKSPADNPSCLFFDGKNLYSGDSITNTVYKHEMKDGFLTASSYPTSAKRLVGMYVDGNNLWIADGGTKKIMHYRMDKGLTFVKSYPLDTLKSISAFLVVNNGFAREMWISSDESSEIRILNILRLK